MNQEFPTSEAPSSASLTTPDRPLAKALEALRTAKKARGAVQAT